MNRISKNDTRDAYIKGLKIEESFKRTIEKIYGVTTVIKSSNYDDRVQGIDFWVIFNGKTISFDVKSKKKERGKLFRNKLCLEIKNIYGNPGSLYKGASCFAFEYEEYFILVRTEDLRNLVEQKVDITTKPLSTTSHNIYTYNKGYKLYTPLTRSNWNRDTDNKPNEDVIVYISVFDLIIIPFTKLLKTYLFLDHSDT